MVLFLLFFSLINAEAPLNRVTTMKNDKQGQAGEKQDSLAAELTRAIILTQTTLQATKFSLKQK